MELLFDILKYKRGYETVTEWEFLQKHIATIPNVEFDSEFNYWVWVGDKEQTQTMFSCHTDTVHWDKGYQKFLYFEDLEIIAKTTLKKDPDFDNECLGADDGAGVWIMLNMIEAGVPGLYVFHRGEELGGIGSTYITQYNQELVKNIKRCIAFDRRGRHDIITHQAGDRCCSDEFAWELAMALCTANPEIDMVPSQKGLFTDSANYTHLIPECTNLSVGYEMEHTPNEELDVDHLKNLLAACLVIDWEALPTHRDCDDVFDWTGHVLSSPKSQVQQYMDHQYGTGSATYPTRNKAYLDDDDLPWSQRGYEALTFRDALDIAQSSPEVVAELLLELGVTYDDVENTHNDLYGTNGNYRYSK